MQFPVSAYAGSSKNLNDLKGPTVVIGGGVAAPYGRDAPVPPPPLVLPEEHFADKGSREKEIFIDNLLVRVHLIIEMSRPALRHGSLNSLFQVA